MNDLNRAISRLARRILRRQPTNERGVAMVEFGLVFPMFIVLVIGLMEFAVMFNALLGVNFASRDAALIAAEAGTNAWADCVVLNTVENRVTSPADRSRINEVRIYRASVHGTELAANVYQRGGTSQCPLPDGTQMTVNFVRVATGYPVDTRCDVLEGCGGGRTLDTIGVTIRYDHTWVTPLAGLVTLTGDGYEFTRSNAMRMEPVL